MRILMLSQFIPPTMDGEERHVALVPSVAADSCPTVAIEAMSMGKPVIASHIGEPSNMVLDGQTGCLAVWYPLATPMNLRDTIQGLLADPVCRGRIGNAAKQHVAAFQAAEVVAQIEHAYQEVLTSCAV